MIRRYNRKQILLSILAAAVGLVCYFLAYCFFGHFPAVIASQFGVALSPLATTSIWVISLLALTASGYRTWQAGGGLLGYHESAFYHERDIDSGGSLAVDIYLHRITGSAHLVSQIFLAGPLGLLRAGTLIASRLPTGPDREKKLAEVLQILVNANKWQPITDYPGLETEIFQLAQMDKIDFSAVKGVPRIKAHRE